MQYNTETNQIEFTKITNDVNGNGRYVCHFFDLLTPEEKLRDFAPEVKGITGSALSLERQYQLAVKGSKAFGGKKYSNKQYGGGIVFQRFAGNTELMSEKINELLSTVNSNTKKTFYFATGVNTNLYPNSPAFIPFECENVPNNAKFDFACDNPNLHHESGYFVAPIVGGKLLSKYAYFIV